MSLVGSEVTALALPLMAAVTLGASPLEMGLLAAARELPFLLLSLPAGIIVDRVRRRPLLILADLASAVLLLSVPLSLPFGGPTLAQLCLVAFGVGGLTAVFEIAHYAYVPALVGRERLTEVNSRLQLSYSAAAAAGPGLAGLLIQIISAPIAIVVDAASFVISALLLGRIRRREPAPEASDPASSGRRSLSEGVSMMLNHPLLRPIVVGGALLNLFDATFLAVFILYATRDLELDAMTIGLIFAAGGVGAIPGALVAARVGDRIGLGPAILVGWAVWAFAALAAPFATGPAVLVVIVLASAKAVGGLSFTVANIHQWSLRQAVTPDHLGGRVTAAHRFIVYGAGALGALLGGVMASAIGLRATLVVAAVGMVGATGVAATRPLRRLREQPGVAVTQ